MSQKQCRVRRRYKLIHTLVLPCQRCFIARTRPRGEAKTISQKRYYTTINTSFVFTTARQDLKRVLYSIYKERARRHIYRRNATLQLTIWLALAGSQVLDLELPCAS